MSSLQDQTDQTCSAFVDNPGQGAPEFPPDILRHLDQLGCQPLPDQIIDGLAEDVAFFSDG